MKKIIAMLGILAFGFVSFVSAEEEAKTEKKVVSYEVAMTGVT